MWTIRSSSCDSLGDLDRGAEDRAGVDRVHDARACPRGDQAENAGTGTEVEDAATLARAPSALS